MVGLLIAYLKLEIATAGKYYIVPPYVNAYGGLAYISVSGVAGGNAGASGIPIDFIDSVTSGTNTIVGSTGYLYTVVAFNIKTTTSGSYIITFIRTDTITSGVTSCLVKAYNETSTIVEVTLADKSLTSVGSVVKSAPS